MSLIIRNKNISIYKLKQLFRKSLYSNYAILTTCLKTKEILVKNIGNPKNGKNILFEKIFIETISYCNNNCSFCPASYETGAKNPHNFMSEDLFMKIMAELKGLSYSGSIAFHCNNEPLLDERLPSLIQKARALLKTNYFYLSTNGILLDIKLTHKLFETGLDRIIINNYNDTHKLIPCVSEIAAENHSFKGELIVNYRAKTDYLCNRAGENPNSMLIAKKPFDIICRRPLKEIVVGYDGTVPLCCADGLWKVVMGDVKKSMLKDIWFSDYFTFVRKSLSTGKRNCTEICKVCDSLNLSKPKGL